MNPVSSAEHPLTNSEQTYQRDVIDPVRRRHFKEDIEFICSDRTRLCGQASRMMHDLGRHVLDHVQRVYIVAPHYNMIRDFAEATQIPLTKVRHVREVQHLQGLSKEVLVFLGGFRNTGLMAYALSRRNLDIWFIDNWR